MVVVNSTIEYAPYSFQTSGSFRTFCEHSDSFWSMSEPAKQASLRKKLLIGGAVKSTEATCLSDRTICILLCVRYLNNYCISISLIRAKIFPKSTFRKSVTSTAMVVPSRIS